MQGRPPQSVRTGLPEFHTHIPSDCTKRIEDLLLIDGARRERLVHHDGVHELAKVNLFAAVLIDLEVQDAWNGCNYLKSEEMHQITKLKSITVISYALSSPKQTVFYSCACSALHACGMTKAIQPHWYNRSSSAHTYMQTYMDSWCC